MHCHHEILQKYLYLSCYLLDSHCLALISSDFELCAEKRKNFNKLMACFFLLRSLKLTGSSKKYCSLIFIGGGGGRKRALWSRLRGKQALDKKNGNKRIFGMRTQPYAAKPAITYMLHLTAARSLMSGTKLHIQFSRSHTHVYELAYRCEKIVLLAE